MKTHMDIYNIYKDEPFFQLKIKLENESTLFIKWNVFKDEKNNNKPIMRTGYTLVDKNNKRQSLKTLELKQSIEFKEIEMTESLEEILDGIYFFNDREMLISMHFGQWINDDFIGMINSGNTKIISMNTHKEGCKLI